MRRVGGTISLSSLNNANAKLHKMHTRVSFLMKVLNWVYIYIVLYDDILYDEDTGEDVPSAQRMSSIRQNTSQ